MRPHSNAFDPLDSSASLHRFHAPEPLMSTENDENERLGVLPRFGANKDARRQSLAMGAMFQDLSAGAGLLGDAELAIGDGEIQVPLASCKLLGMSRSLLRVEPDTHSLGPELPSPSMATQHGVPSCRRVTAMRASTVLGDLHRACEGLGLDDVEDGDNFLQESGRVKELAVLFKSGAGAAAVSRPGAYSPVGSTDGGWASSRHLLQQFQASSSMCHAAHQQAVDPQLAAFQPHGAEPASVPTRRPQRIGAEHNAAAGKVWPTSLRPSPRPPAGNARSLPQPAGTSTSTLASTAQHPAPPSHASRLRPPTMSSGYFSNAATNTRHATLAAPTRSRARAVPINATRTPVPAKTRKAAEPQRAAGPMLSSATQPVPSPQAQQSRSRIPTPPKFGAARRHPANLACSTGTSMTKTPMTKTLPMVRVAEKAPSPPQGGCGSAGRGVEPASPTLLYLEQNPHFAFGGGTKLADSPSEHSNVPAKKLNAEERHLMEWNGVSL
ncbi:hypothetical protein ACK3TF_005109 [Chlorella vulgaris]